MTDTTSWAPSEGADLVAKLQAEGRNVQDLGEQVLHSMNQLTGDGLLGASADGANQLAAGIHGTAQAVQETTAQVSNHVSNYGENMVHMDGNYGAMIAGG